MSKGARQCNDKVVAILLWREKRSAGRRHTRPKARDGLPKTAILCQFQCVACTTRMYKKSLYAFSSRFLEPRHCYQGEGHSRSNVSSPCGDSNTHANPECYLSVFGASPACGTPLIKCTMLRDVSFRPSLAKIDAKHFAILWLAASWQALRSVVRSP